MNELSLVSDDGNEPVTTSEIIANGTETQHKNIMELIRNNLDDLREVGNCAFETRNQVGAGRPTEYAVLDEPAATLLITYMRNTEIVREFKKQLVIQFYEMRRRMITRPMTRKQLGQMIVDAEEALEIEQAARQEAEDYARELEPVAESWLNLADAEGDYDVGDAAAILNRDSSIDTGRTRLFKFMSDKGWVQKVGYSRERHWRPYQTQITAGRLRMRPGAPYWDDDIQRTVLGNPQVRVTIKGIHKLHKLLRGSDPVATLIAVNG